MHLDFGGWIRDFRDEWRTGNQFLAVMGALQDLHNGLFFSLTSRYPLGTNVFDKEWDMLVVLDGCRVDALTELAPEYDFITSVDSIWSVGSASHEWICKTYTTDHRAAVQDTALISSNPWYSRAFREQQYPPGKYCVPIMWADWDVVVADDFGELLTIHQHEHKDMNLPPHPDLLTDHAIKTGRNSEHDKIIVHYMQPHRPHGSKAYEEERKPTDTEFSPWQAIRSGRASKEMVWENYLNNLRMVLDSVETLLSNVDADRVAITADHGDLFGEFGAYGHPAGFIHPNLKKVPWVVTSASDHRTVTPTVELSEEGDSTDVDGQLRALGYM